MLAKPLQICGIGLPLPEDWHQAVNGASYVGPEGLLDIRTNAYAVPVDENRLQLIEEQLSSRGATVGLRMIQGVNCLCASYKQEGCWVITYTFGITLDNDITAVYVFYPGHEDLAEWVQQAIVQSDKEIS